MRGFAEEKKRWMERLVRELKEGKVDPDIIPVLELINGGIEECYTTSSCSGRIIIIESSSPGDKPGARILGKWHRRVSPSEVADALRRTTRDAAITWASSQGPLIHVVCRSLEAAKPVLDAALSAGFKHSCIHVYGDRVVVEIRSAERIDLPISYRGRKIIDDPYLLTDILNYYFSLGRRRLERLKKAFMLTLGSRGMRLSCLDDSGDEKHRPR